MKKNLGKSNVETLTAHSGKNPSENHGIPAPPLYRTSTILSSNMNNYRNRTGKYTYGRNGTPTSDSLISKIKSSVISDGFMNKNTLNNIFIKLTVSKSLIT